MFGFRFCYEESTMKMLSETQPRFGCHLSIWSIATKTGEYKTGALPLFLFPGPGAAPASHARKYETKFITESDHVYT